MLKSPDLSPAQTPSAHLPPPAPLPAGATVPMSAEQVRALQGRVSALNAELRGLDSRRSQLVRQFRRGGPGSEGLMQQIQGIDQQAIQITTELTQTQLQLASAPAQLAMPTATFPPFERRERYGMTSEDLGGISAVVTLFVLFPIALAMARRIWTRSVAPRSERSPEDSQRLERVEQAIDSIAIEVERISEGQRFVTKLLAERAPTALAAGTAQPVPIPSREAVPAGRNER